MTTWLGEFRLNSDFRKEVHPTCAGAVGDLIAEMNTGAAKTVLNS